MYLLRKEKQLAGTRKKKKNAHASLLSAELQNGPMGAVYNLLYCEQCAKCGTVWGSSHG
jgi:hypothetical protein